MGNMTRQTYSTTPARNYQAPKTGSVKDATGVTYTGSGQPMDVGRRQGQGQGKRVCYFCGYKGHVAKECKQQLNGCFKCKQKGHAIKDCPQNVRQGKIREINQWQEEVHPQSYYEPSVAGTLQHGGRSVQGDGHGHITPFKEETTEDEKSLKDNAQ
jgi:Zinc knuckle